MANKITLYFIHGWGMNQAVWQKTIQSLASTYEVKCIDIAGFGSKSKQPLTPFNLANISEEVATEMTQPGWIIGWSMGGLIAQYLALHLTDKIQGLVTVASTPCFAEKKQAQWLGIKPKVLDSFQQQLSLDYVKTLERFLAIQAMGSPTAKEDIKYLKQLLLTYPEPALSALTGGLSLLEEVDLREQIKMISQPTLRLYGRLDSLVPYQAVDAINQLQPNAQSYIFKHASHAPFLSHQEEFTRQLTDFIQYNHN